MNNGFESLGVWQKARELENKIFERLVENPGIKDFNYKSQVSASSGSVMDNIAEGHGRGGNKEFIQFLYISRGSLQELKSQVYRAFDRKYIVEDIFKSLFGI